MNGMNHNQNGFAMIFAIIVLAILIILSSSFFAPLVFLMNQKGQIKEAEQARILAHTTLQYLLDHEETQELPEGMFQIEQEELPGDLDVEITREEDESILTMKFLVTSKIGISKASASGQKKISLEVEMEEETKTYEG